MYAAADNLQAPLLDKINMLKVTVWLQFADLFAAGRLAFCWLYAGARLAFCWLFAGRIARFAGSRLACLPPCLPSPCLPTCLLACFPPCMQSNTPAAQQPNINNDFLYLFLYLFLLGLRKPINKTVGPCRDLLISPYLWTPRSWQHRVDCHPPVPELCVLACGQNQTDEL